MKLLTPEEVKKDKKKGDEDRLRTIERLKADEIKIVKRINELHEVEKKEKSRILAEKADLEKTLAIKRTEIAKTESEVRQLEDRKREAQKPLLLRQKALDEREKALDTREAQIATKIANLSEKTAKLEDEQDALFDFKDALDDRQTKLDEREAGIAREEQSLKIEQEKLAKKSVQFHEEFHILNADLRQRETDVKNQSRANHLWSLELKAEEDRLKKLDLAVQDKYAALARAKKHLGIK